MRTRRQRANFVVLEATKLRLQAGLSLSEFSNYCRVSRSTIRRIESGKGVSHATAQRVAECLLELNENSEKSPENYIRRIDPPKPWG